MRIVSEHRPRQALSIIPSTKPRLVDQNIIPIKVVLINIFDCHIISHNSVF